MKVVIIILILIVIGFAVAIGVAVYRATTPPPPPSAHGPPTDSEGNIDEDALADWKPPSLADAMAKLSRPFAPKVFKKAMDVTVQKDSEEDGAKSEIVQVPPADKDMRIARLRLIMGQGAIATYTAPIPGEGQKSPQHVCLCFEGTLLDADEVEACGKPWLDARPAGDDKVRCREKDDDVSAVIYRSGGVIEVTPLGDQQVKLTVR